ncbi:hypothetical protein M407DRAFT_121816 [Tulasnella calospora MUT 4182]|uniref:Uncharacterized protein n=1 Tax=Tulasnella calospora MUT 4182 TaxID=1051891 RepID=A0A0C3LD91_9AGAM|nr:hypothetical protein M407DRAFT_121816 [Tulasnella calospora MUT 4182]
MVDKAFDWGKEWRSCVRSIWCITFTLMFRRFPTSSFRSPANSNSQIRGTSTERLPPSLVSNSDTSGTHGGARWTCPSTSDSQSIPQ